MINFLDSNAISEMFNISERNARKFLRSEGLQTVKIGVKYYVSEDVLKDFLRENREVALYDRREAD